MKDAKDLIDRYYTAFNARDRAAYENLFAQDAETHAPGAQGVKGTKAVRDWDMTWAAAFPDARITSLRKCAEGALVISENRFAGTHKEPLRTPEGEIKATGKKVDVPYIAVFDVDSGRIRTQRIYYDRAELMSQLGLK